MDEASRFLQWLDPDAKRATFVFQTFDDQGRGWGGNTYSAPSLTEELKNLNAHGFGIGVTINELAGTVRRNENVSRIRAVWMDWDHQDREPDLPLTPSVIVQTSPGKRHFYWLILDTWPVSGTADGLADFKAVMSRLVELGHDRQCCDPARAMRLPGSYHHKGAPFRVSITHPCDGLEPRYYRRDEIVEAFRRTVVPEAPKPKWDDSGADADLADRVTEALARIPSDDRRDWRDVGMALHSARDQLGGESHVFRMWKEWSKQSEKWNEGEARRQWESFKDRPDGQGIGIGTLLHRAGNSPAVAPIVPLGPNIIPKAPLSIPGEALAEATLREMRKTFEGYNHYPSEAHWEALGSITSHLESFVSGTAKPLFFMSSLDPGIGKTQTVSHFVRALLAEPRHSDTAALICVGRLAEINSYVRDMGLANDAYAVLVHEQNEVRIENRGNYSPDTARVLFTTQQMLETRIKRAGSFTALREFFYQGKPRQLRIWDESALPARPITIDVTDIEQLTKVALDKNPAFHRLLDKLNDDIKLAENGSIVSVPSFEDEMTPSTALGVYAEATQAHTDILKDLYLVAGQAVSVSKDGGRRTMVTYENTLPDDLKPMLILDASGRVRKTYPCWAEGRYDLVAIAEAQKSYEPMTLHLWKNKGSKSAWRDTSKAMDMLEAIIDVVDSRPNEEFLIVHHKTKGRDGIDLPDWIRKMADSPGRLRFTHWGSEDCKATNQFKDISNVILAGTLFMPSFHYEALGRMTLNLSSTDKLGPGVRREIELGEHAHLILQAVTRGAARKVVDGNKCGKSDVWIIASDRSGIPQMLGQIFKESRIVEWLPPENADACDRAISALEAFKRGTEPFITVTGLRTLAGGEVDQSNFNDLLLNNREVAEAMGNLGLMLKRQRGRGGSRIQRAMTLPPI